MYVTLSCEDIGILSATYGMMETVYSFYYLDETFGMGTHSTFRTKYSQLRGHLRSDISRKLFYRHANREYIRMRSEVFPL